MFDAVSSANDQPGTPVGLPLVGSPIGATAMPGPLTLGPRTIERPTDAGYTLVAGLDGATPARVDGGGLVVPHGATWSIDWWIGADDRWHLPAREPSVRQRRVGYGPVIETALRVPSGDVTHTAYPVMAGGRTVTVVEIYNDSPVPVALALAVRPYDVNGEVGKAAEHTLALDGTDLTVNDQVAVVLPRPPNEMGAAADADLLAAVTAGESLTWSSPVSGPVANAVCLYPLPHKTSLRFAIPGPAGGATVAVDRLTEAAASARGWTAIVERAARFEFPDPGITELAGAARARLLLEAERLAGRVLAAEPGAGFILQALAAGGHQVECGWALDALGRSFPARLSADPMPSAEVVSGAAAAAELLGELDRTEALLEPMTQLAHLIDRAERKKDASPATALALSSLATLAELTGQHEAASELRDGSRAEPASASIFADGGGRAGVPSDGDVDGDVDAATDPSGLDRLMALAADAAPAGRWNPDDSAAKAAAYWMTARRLLIKLGDDQTPGQRTIELLPEFPTAWRGGAVEVHRAPIGGCRVSFAIRWHGYRPALLWDVEQPELSEGTDTAPPTIALSCPGLDSSWSTTELKGETLLTGVADELPDAPAPGDSFG